MDEEFQYLKAWREWREYKRRFDADISNAESKGRVTREDLSRADELYRLYEACVAAYNAFARKTYG